MADIKVDGMNQLLSRLRQMGDKVDIAIDVALTKAANNLQKEMKSEATFTQGYSTGNLRESIKVSDISGTGINRQIAVGPEKGKGSEHDGWYAHFLEFSTSKMAAQPFIEPAFLKTRNQNQEIIKDTIKQALGL
jgi:HK97 gp10 family phage protein